MEVQKFVVEKLVRKFFRARVVRPEAPVPYRSRITSAMRLAYLSEPGARFTPVKRVLQ